MVFRLFSVVLLIFCGAGFAQAEYILRLPNFSEMRFESAETENIKSPFLLHPRRGAPFTNTIEQQKEFDASLDKLWSVIRPKEKIMLQLDLPHFAPEPASGDHIWIFYTTHTGVLAVNGKEIFFPYSQIFIDKHYFGFMDVYRHCLHDITPPNWPKDEPRLYGSIPMVIRGVIDRLETDEPFLWEGRVDSVRFMDVYLRDIEVLEIDCK